MKTVASLLPLGAFQGQLPFGLVRVTMLLLLLLPYTVNSQQRNGVCTFRGEDESKFIRVPEDTAVGTELFRVLAYPRRNFNIQAIDGSRPEGYFSFREVDRRRVAVILSKSLQDLVDQSAPINSLEFRLACRGREGETDYLPITVFIEDVNDHSPEFMNIPYEVVIDELTPPGLTIFRGIQALDRDKPNTANSEITYSIVSGNEQRKFSIEGVSKTSSVLVLRNRLDFDKGEKEFNLTVKAEDHGSPPKKSLASVHIVVRDRDDLNPKFTRKVYNISIDEDYPVTDVPIQRELSFDPPIRASDQDLGLNASLQYFIVEGNSLEYFEIDPATGRLFLVREVDREEVQGFSLKLEAKQKDNELKSDFADVYVTIKDINDNVPVFDIEEYNMTIVENLPHGFEVMNFVAQDKDEGVNADFIYVVSDPSGAFEVDRDAGTLRIKDPKVFDREKNEVIELDIQAIEMEPSVREDAEGGTVRIRINVEDENDNEPVFLPENKYVFVVPSLAVKGQAVGSVKATDPDLGLNGIVRYKVRDVSEDDPFGIDAATGQIRVKNVPLDKQR